MPVLYLHSSDNTGTGKTSWVTQGRMSLTAEERDRGELSQGRKQHPEEGMHTQHVSGAAHAASFTLKLPEGAADGAPPLPGLTLSQDSDK